MIAVTGLGGKAFMSWQHQSGAMWLRDYLPRDVPDVQIFIYGYRSKLVGSGSHARLQDYVAAFLREWKDLCSRPGMDVSAALRKLSNQLETKPVLRLETSSYPP